MNTHCQSGLGIARAGRFVSRWCGHIYGFGRRTKNIFGSYRPGDLRSVFVLGDRKDDLDASRDIPLPPAPGEGIALRLEKTVADGGSASADVESRRALVAAINDVVQDGVVTATGIDGF